MRGNQTGVAYTAKAPNKAKTVLAATALAGLMVAAGCGKARVCAPGAPGPDFQKAVLIRCLGGDALVDLYLSGFRNVSTSDRVEFLVALQLAQCPPEALEWQARNRKTIASPTPKE